MLVIVIPQIFIEQLSNPRPSELAIKVKLFAMVLQLVNGSQDFEIFSISIYLCLSTIDSLYLLNYLIQVL